MTQRALLIGCQTWGLQGVDHDIEQMCGALSAFGFDIRHCVGADASRQGILDSYQRLIADTSAGDAAVVYYSGHGGLAPNPDYAPLDASGVVRPRAYQFIVPVDMDQSSEEDFRGITDLELSALLAALTQKTRNATVILDCCHAARMSRDVEMTPKARPRPWLIGVDVHVERIRRQGLATDQLAPESNRDAVRLVACGPSESAFEYTTATGQRTGVMTESLVMALQESHDLRISWRTLAQRVRSRVVDRVVTQRPDVEGPSDRVLFGTETLDETGILAVDIRGGIPALLGGRLLGVEIGDRYVIVPPGDDHADLGEALADATVIHVDGARAGLEIKYRPGYADLRDGVRAVPLRKALHRYPVRILGAMTARAMLAAEIDKSSHVHAADDAISDSADILAQVEVTDDSIALRDPSGNPLAYPQQPDAQGLRETIQNLIATARAQLLRELRSGQDGNRLDTPFTVEWGRVQQGRPQPLSKTGELLFPGDAVYIQVANKGREPLYVSIFDIGLSGRIGLITTSEPSGVQLLPGADYVVGAERPSGRLAGLPLSWPASVPEEGQHTETLVAIVSDRPQDLRALEQRGMRSLQAGHSELQRLLDQIGHGGLRDLPSEATGETDVRYAVDQITFLVDPSPAPARDVAPFLIDERPDLSLLYQAARSAEPVPAEVAIRLTDLIVHRSRVLFGSEFKGDIRIDTVVVTGPTTDGDHPLYRMETARFPAIRDGDRLPFDNLLVFLGSVATFLDIAVWVSRDQTGSPSLEDLFQKEFNSTEFEAAALTLAGLAGSAPQAAAVVAALGAGATICNISSTLLSAAPGSGIGLYRTSILAQEGFGVGRHPPSGTMRAQDFSFAFEIRDVARD